jgi:hypothetical protein
MNKKRRPSPPKGVYQEIGSSLGALVDKKNEAYGNSFLEVEQFMCLLYPDGITPEQYTDVLCLVRIFDKMKRIATAKGAFEESPYLDLAGYGLLGAYKDQLDKDQQNADLADALGEPASGEPEPGCNGSCQVRCCSDKRKKTVLNG